MPTWLENGTGSYITTFSGESDDSILHACLLIAAVVVSIVAEQIILPMIFYALALLDRRLRQTEDTEMSRTIVRKFRTQLIEFDRLHPVQTSGVHSASALAAINDIKRRLVRVVVAVRHEKDTNASKPSLLRIYSCHSYVAFLAWIVFLAFSHLDPLNLGFLLSQILRIASIVMICLNYLIVLVESCFSHEKQYIKNLSPVMSAVERIGLIRNGQPTVSFSAVAYHYETRAKFVTRTDSNGNTHITQQNYRAKVITAHVTQPYTYQLWQDRSQRTLVDIKSKQVTKIKVELVILFGDAVSAADFEKRYLEFQNEHRHRDSYVDFSIDRSAPCFEKRLAAFLHNSAQSVWINLWLYWLSTLLGLGWIYRLIFMLVAAKTNYKVVKVIYAGRRSDGVVAAVNDVDGQHAGILDWLNNETDEDNNPQLHGALVLQARRSIETILRNMETATDAFDTLPLMLADEADFMPTAAENHRQLYGTL